MAAGASPPPNGKRGCGGWIVEVLEEPEGEARGEARGAGEGFGFSTEYPQGVGVFHRLLPRFSTNNDTLLYSYTITIALTITITITITITLTITITITFTFTISCCDKLAWGELGKVAALLMFACAIWEKKFEKCAGFLYFPWGLFCNRECVIIGHRKAEKDLGLYDRTTYRYLYRFYFFGLAGLFIGR